MLRIVANSRNRAGVVTRREALRAGFLGVGALSLADLLAVESQAASERSDTAVILLWCSGGPSQLETYDMKPQAPVEIRGPMNPIKTNVQGIEVCELLPEHAKIADKFTLIRSVHHKSSGHPDGTFRFTSGFPDDKPGGLGVESAYPCITAVVNKALGVSHNGLPVALNTTLGGHWYGSPGYLGEMYRVPGVSRGQPNWTLNVQPGQLANREALLGQLDRLKSNFDQRGHMVAMDHFRRQAAELLLSGTVSEAFDFSKEDRRLVARYGEGLGEQCLVARRLVERGVRLVTCYVQGRPPWSDGKNYDWDDHAVNWDLIAAMHDRLPWYDRSVSTLIRDLFDRGLNKKVLLLVTGEFGRTPRVDTNAPGRFGRDHWPGSMSMLISGGRGPLGAVIGATNSKAEYPVERPLDPDDIRATLLHHLGIDYHQSFVNTAGRPIQICYGQHLPEWA